MKPLALRPEDELLVCCARTQLEPEQSARIRALVGGAIHWDYLLEAARRQGLRPLLYRHLSTSCPEAPPDNFLRSLQEMFERNERRNLEMLDELKKVLDLFENHDIPAIPYKGPILAVSVYRDLSLREFGDLDILVGSTMLHGLRGCSLRRDTASSRGSPAPRKSLISRLTTNISSRTPSEALPLRSSGQ